MVLHSFMNRAQGILIYGARQQARLTKECRSAEVEQILSAFEKTCIYGRAFLYSKRIQGGINRKVLFPAFFGISLSNGFQDIKTREEGIDDLRVKMGP